MTTTYYAERGKIFARTPDGTREVTTALSTNGRDLERFERARTIARMQEPIETVTPETVELLGITEIAKLTGLAAQTVRNYRQRGTLPAPDYELAVGSVWKRETIEQWDRERNRRPGPSEELRAEWRERKTGAA